MNLNFNAKSLKFSLLEMLIIGQKCALLVGLLSVYFIEVFTDEQNDEGLYFPTFCIGTQFMCDS